MSTHWGLWSIHADGTNWAPMVSALPPRGQPERFHFQTQLSDGSIVAEEYYNQTSSGFGGYLKFRRSPALLRSGRPTPPILAIRRSVTDAWTTASRAVRRLPFSPFGVEALTTFARAR